VADLAPLVTLVLDSLRVGDVRALALLVTLTGAVAAVHVFTPGLRTIDSLPHRAVVSAAGGVSVAYVFVHLLPEVTAAHEALGPGAPHSLPFEAPVYLVVLAGFVGFYGLERLARDSTNHEDRDLFWAHVGSFGAYNVVLGYLLVDRFGKGFETATLFAVAVGLHLLVTDHGLHQHHAERYHRYGRWVLAVAVVLGSVFGLLVHLSHLTVGLVVAFLTGAIVLNVVKEELPGDSEARFGPFLAGAVGYTAVLALI
jgi:hypothetical protein